MTKRLLLVVAVLTMLGCNVTRNLQDGYQEGDVATGLVENKRAYCSPIYIPIRAIGRWILRMIAYPVPDVCKTIDFIAR